MKKKIIIVCHDNGAIFYEPIIELKKFILDHYGAAPDLLIIRQKKISRNSMARILLIETRDVIDIISSFFSIYFKYRKLVSDATVVYDRINFLAKLTEYKIVYIITSKFILDKETLKGKNCYNLHCGLLPSYRGLLPIFWAFMEGQKMGITLHKIDHEIDKGKVIANRCYKLNKSYYKTLKDLYLIGVDLIKNPKVEFKASKFSTKEYYKMPSVVEIFKYRFKRIFS
jgi:folate-dependent phosphoribosylglycinamide formyltransferase PurN